MVAALAGWARPANLAATVFEVSGEEDTPAIAWTDGPAMATVAAITAPPAGWEFLAADPDGTGAGPASDVSGGGPVIELRRRLDDLALAVAVARFYAATGRHWSSDERPAGWQTWRALTDIDDPATSGYPIPDTVARLLLDAADPPDLPTGGSRADVVSAKLAAVGYERLWAVAFARVP